MDSSLPLKQVPELLVIGGGLSGCMAAVEAAERGKSVLVVEKRPYLGREISAYNHTFVATSGADDALRRCPEPFRRLLATHANGELLVPEGTIRQELLCILEDRDIPILLEAEPVAVSTVGACATGVLLACPAGLAWLPGQGIIDATERRHVVRLLTDRPHLHEGRTLVHAAFELTMPSASVSALLSSPLPADHAGAEDVLQLVPDSLRYHPTMRGDVVLVEYAFHASATGESCGRRSQIETAARRRSVELATWLRESVTTFSQAGLYHMGFECHVEQADDAVPEASTCCTNVTVLPPLPWGFSLDDVACLADTIRSTDFACQAPANPTTDGLVIGRGLRIPQKDIDLRPYEDDALRVPLFVADFPQAIAPASVLTSDICVAGVGAGGGMAMLAAAERGRSVTAIEVNRELGGTHTSGRVIGYYAGYREGASKAVAEAASATAPSALTISTPGGPRHARFLLESAHRLDVFLLTGTRVCGVRVTDDSLERILAANEDGLFAIDATVTIDATGDADVAALAGVPYDMGDDRDGMPQSYSMWGAELYPTPSFLAQRFLTDPGIFHPDLYSERLRAVSVAHRDNSPNHISPMLTPRESRRIRGEYSLRLDDILKRRVFDDVVAVACTQADSHAFTSSVAARLGGIGSGVQLRVGVPYRCFVPRGIDGLLVAAKAISGERDATSFCRMNADIKNAGYAIGIAAAMAVEAGVGVRDIGVLALQTTLKQLGILPPWAFETEVRETVADTVASLRDVGLPALDSLLHAHSPEAAKAELEQRYSALPAIDADPAGPFQCGRALACMALAWHGATTGRDDLVSLLNRAVAGGLHRTLPRLRPPRMHLNWGALGQDDYSLVNRLLVFVGKSPGSDVVPSLATLIDETPGLGGRIPLAAPYDRRRKDIVTQSFYHRLQNVAYAVEHNATPELAPSMEGLLRRPGLTGHDVPMESCASPRYMLAHLELCLARAAARCGSQVGVRILRRYQNDTHVFFRRHARQELRAIGG